MDTEKLMARRKEILLEMASMDRMRRGSVVEQYVEVKNKKGEVVQRGPYPLYTFKDRGKTISRRLKSQIEVETYRQQIKNFRRFEELTKELRKIGEALCEAPDESQKKKRRSSPSSRTRK